MKTYDPYDPFEVFQPSQEFIKEVIRELKSESSRLLDDQRVLQEPWQDWLLADIAVRHARLVRRVQSLEFRLSRKRQTGRWDSPPADPGRITDADINEAKSIPIIEHYPGKLRRMGKRYVGKCPFGCSDRNPSFVIYPTNDCWSFCCNQGGDVIWYIQKTQGLKFVEAIKYLINI